MDRLRNQHADLLSDGVSSAVELGGHFVVPSSNRDRADGPMLMASHDFARFGIGGWMLGFAALGWTLVVTAGDQYTERSIPTKAGDLR